MSGGATHLGAVFQLSQALNNWITAHTPESLYTGTFWALCIAPVAGLVAWAALKPESPSSRSRAPVLLGLIFGALVLARLPLLCFDRINPDESFLLASAMRVRVDPVPYRSFDVMTSGPLNVYALSLPAWFGASLTYVTARLTGVLLVFGTLAALWFAQRRFLGERWGAVALLPSFFFYLFAWDADFVHCSSEHVAIFLGAMALALLAAEFQESNAGLWRLMAAGVLAGSMMFAKLQALPMGAVTFGIAMLLAWRRPRRSTAIAALAAAAAVVPTAFLLLFWRYGVLGHFWLTYFRKNMAYAGATSLSPLGKLAAARDLLFQVSNLGAYETGLIVVWVVGLLAAIALLRRADRWRTLRDALALAAAAWLLLAISFAAVAAPGREFMHYELFLIVPSGLVTASSLLWIRLWMAQRAPHPWRARAGVAALLLATCVLPTALRDHIDDAWDADRFNPYAPLPSTIRQYTNDGDAIVVWGWRAGLHIASNRIPAIRYADSELQIEPAVYRDYYRAVYLADLMRARPKVFVDGVGPGAFVYTDRDEAGYETFGALRDFIDRNYHLVTDLEGARIFVCNEEPVQARLEPGNQNQPARISEDPADRPH